MKLLKFNINFSFLFNIFTKSGGSYCPQNTAVSTHLSVNITDINTALMMEENDIVCSFTVDADVDLLIWFVRNKRFNYEILQLPRGCTNL